MLSKSYITFELLFLSLLSVAMHVARSLQKDLLSNGLLGVHYVQMFDLSCLCG